MPVTRRTFNCTLAATAAALALPSRSRAQPMTDRPQWLLFTKSAGHEHDTVKQNNGPSYLAQQLASLFESRKLGLRESKNGSDFEPATIRQFAGLVFYTTGDLTTPGTDKSPPMSEAGKQALTDAVADGMPFIGLHCASDTFHSGADQPSDYTKMLGGEFDDHGDQQVATAQIVDNDFPGVGTQADWTITEEWYALKNIAQDVHPIHRLDPKKMKGDMYRREPYPITWTRMHGKGRVFYTAMGHREDVIASKAYLTLIGGAIDWCRGS